MILITGAAGFIGSSLALELLKTTNHKIIGIDNLNDYYSVERKKANLKELESFSNFEFKKLDFIDLESLDKLFKEYNFETVAHIGAMANARYSIKNPRDYLNSNINGTFNLIELSNKYKVNNFVFGSTSSAYGRRSELPFIEDNIENPILSMYSASKKACEDIGYTFHNLHNLNFTVLRFFNVYGPKGRPDMMPYIVVDKILNDQEITIFGDGSMKRDWTYVDDIISGVIAAINTPLGFEKINLGKGEPVSLNEFINIAEELCGKKAIRKEVQIPNTDTDITYASIKKAKDLLNYNPQTSLPIGYKHFYEWYNKNHF